MEKKIMEKKITLIAFMLNVALVSAQYFTQNSNAGDYTSIALSQAGACLVDYNNDGFVDIIVAGYDNSSENRTRVYLNNTDKTFSALNSSDIYEIGNGGPLLIAGDYDNDGDSDIYKLNFQDASGNAVNNVLYENSGEPNFDILQTTLVGVSGEENYSGSGTWVDYDLDGDLDLFATGAIGTSDLFYRNDNGMFTSITSLAFIQSRAWFITTDTWFDFDGDGDLDVYFSNFQGNPNKLYLSQLIESGNPNSFIELQVGGITNNGGNNIGCNWIDYDNDLDLDLFVNYFDEQDRLYRNNGDNTFTMITNQPMFQNNGWTTVNSWSDYDNDGDLDLYINIDDGSSFSGFLYENDGGGQFSEVNSALAGDITNAIVSPQGGGWLDYDNDGDMDLTVITCCATFPNGAPVSNIIYENTVGQNNNYSKIYLEGIQANKSGIGAEVQLKATIDGNSYWQTRRINGGVDSFGMQEEQMAHFGLGNATVIDSLIIKWPSGVIDMCENLPIGSIKMTEENCIPTLLGVDDLIEESLAIKVYPNPTKSRKLFINTDFNNEIKEMKLLNVLGEIINKKINIKSINNNLLEIDLIGHETGVYFLQIELKDSNRFISKKIIITN